VAANEKESDGTSVLSEKYRTSLGHQILVKIELEVEVCTAIVASKCDSYFIA
jgi:hypothetical protein